MIERSPPPLSAIVGDTMSGLGLAEDTCSMLKRLSLTALSSVSELNKGLAEQGEAICPLSHIHQASKFLLHL